MADRGFGEGEDARRTDVGAEEGAPSADVGAETDPPATPTTRAEAAARAIAWRAAKDRWLRNDSASPIRGLVDFGGLSYWPYDPELRFDVELEPVPRSASDAGRGGLVALTTSAGDTEAYARVGRVQVGGLGSLTVFAPPADPDRLFLPFTDATSGTATYGGGRYLEPERVDPTRVRIDFNYAYHPFCAYSPRYRCAVPPAENRLAASVEAGERLPPDDAA